LDNGSDIPQTKVQLKFKRRQSGGDLKIGIDDNNTPRISNLESMFISSSPKPNSFKPLSMIKQLAIRQEQLNHFHRQISLKKKF